jgi:hypothetical protein
LSATNSERRKAPEKPKGEDGPIPLAREGLRTVGEHGSDDFGGCWSLLLNRGADSPADAAQGAADLFALGGVRLACEAVGVPDRGGRRVMVDAFTPRVASCREECGDEFRGSRGSSP